MFECGKHGWRNLQTMCPVCSSLQSVTSGTLTIPGPDQTLAYDEWWAIFSDYQDLSSGRLSKIPWGGGSNMTSTFKVKRC